MAGTSPPAGANINGAGIIHAPIKTPLGGYMRVPRESWLRLCFLLTQEQWRKIYEHQKGLCAICGNPLPDTCTLTDHDHKSGLIRGLLCFRCNKSLGEDITIPFLLKLLEYLQNPPATQALGHSHYGLPGRVGTKKQRKLGAKLRKQIIHAPSETPLGEQTRK